MHSSPPDTWLVHCVRFTIERTKLGWRPIELPTRSTSVPRHTMQRGHSHQGQGLHTDCLRSYLYSSPIDPKSR